MQQRLASYIPLDRPVFDSLSAWQKYRMGWVSGRVELADQLVTFVAHSFAHGVDPGWYRYMSEPPSHLEFAVALENITAVITRPRLFGATIEIHLSPADTVVVVRCRDAITFANEIESRRMYG